MLRENLVPSIETCFELVNKGFPQTQTEFTFSKFVETQSGLRHTYFCAPTFQEIWNEFPEIVMVKGNWKVNAHLGDDTDLPHSVRIYKCGGISGIELHCGDQTIDAIHNIDCIEENLAQAVAEMWIWLKENAYI